MTAIDGHGDITTARIDGGGAGYSRDHVRLGYAATEPGNQSGTQDRADVPAVTRCEQLVGNAGLDRRPMFFEG